MNLYPLILYLMKLYAKLISNKIIVYHKANLKKAISAKDVSKY